MRGRRFKTQADIDKHIRAGCGQGEGAAYQPWIRVQDLPSKGRSRKVHGTKIDRIYHVLSDVEYLYLLLLEFSEDVIDIREQFPIFPSEKTQRIATDLGIRYPKYQNTSLSFLMTTDFMITRMNTSGEKVLAARTLKLDSDLANSPTLKRRLEKLELEKAILASEGCHDWGIITPDMIGKIAANNLKWMYSGIKLDRQFQKAETLSQFLGNLEYFWRPDRTLASLIRAVTNAMHIPYVDGVNIFKFLAWHKALRFGISIEELQLTKPCAGLRVTNLQQITTDNLKAA